MRILAVLLLATVGATELAAQRPGPAVGTHVGYSRSDLTGPETIQIRSRHGALTGVFLHFPVGRALALRPELLFSLRGGRIIAPDEASGGDITLDIELAYLDLPLLAHFSPPLGRYRPVLFAGAAPSLQIGCDFEIVKPEPERSTCNEVADFSIRGWDLGLVVGGGVEAHLHRSTLALEARYTAGLRSVLEGSQVENRSFALLLALTF